MLMQIAIRNVFRNRRRTALNVVMIMGSFTAIVIFQGFATNLIGKLQAIAIKAQFGHIQVASSKTWHLSPEDMPKDRLVPTETAWAKAIAELPGVQSVSGRISFYGLVMSGEHSLSAHGIAFDSLVEHDLRDSMPIVEGHTLSSDAGYTVILGSGLQDQLGAKVGGNITLLTYTYDGSVNALDAELVGIFRTGLTEIDNSTFYTSLPLAQRLLDSNSVEREVVILDQTPDTDKMVETIQRLLPAGVEAKPWHDLAVYYQQVVDYFRTQNFIVEWIILILAMLAIGNTVGMSISERTGEIGTVRAMGDSLRQVMTQFLFEGLVLGFLGGVAGMLCCVIVSVLLTRMHIPITTPGATAPFPIEIDLVPSAFAQAFALTCLIAVGATLIPAYRASRLKIVEALKRNY